MADHICIAAPMYADSREQKTMQVAVLRNPDCHFDYCISGYGSTMAHQKEMKEQSGYVRLCK